MKLERNFRKRGIHSQLLIAPEYKMVPKLILRQSSYTLVKYVNYLIVISININETYRSKIKFAKKKNKSWKQGGILIYSNSFTQLFNIHINKCKYPWIYMRLLEILDKSQKKIVGILTKLLISQLLDALKYQTRFNWCYTLCFNVYIFILYFTYKFMKHGKL